MAQAVTVRPKAPQLTNDFTSDSANLDPSLIGDRVMFQSKHSDESLQPKNRDNPADSNRLKALGFLVFMGALGFGGVGLNRWLVGSTEGPFSVSTSRRPSPDQKPLISAVPQSVAPVEPESSPRRLNNARRRNDGLRQRGLRTKRLNHEFDAGEASVVIADVPLGPEIEEVMPESPPSNPPVQGRSPVSVPATDTHPDADPKPPGQAPKLIALIESLLKAPQSIAPPAAVAVKPVEGPIARASEAEPIEDNAAPKQSQPIAAPPPKSQPELAEPAEPDEKAKPATPQVPPVTKEQSIAVVPPPATASPSANTPPQEIYVDQLKITGSTKLSQNDLKQVLPKTIASAVTNEDPTVIKRNVTPAELVQTSEAITKLYTDRGYLNSGAYVPKEVLNGAPAEIRVVEGGLEAINVEVEKPKFLGLGFPLSRKYVQGRLHHGIGLPLNSNQLVDAIKLLEQNPLIKTISAVLVPGTITGKSVLNVKAVQAPPVQLNASIDNGRSPSVGRVRQIISMAQANLLGLGDRLQIGFNRSQGSRGFDIGYVLPINAKNGTLSLNYANNNGRVIEEPFQDLDIKSKSQSYTVALRQPIYQTAKEEFALGIRATHYRNAGVYLETFNREEGRGEEPLIVRGTDLDGVTKITALRFGQEYLRRSEKDVVSLQSEFSVGFGALGSTILPAGQPDSRFFAWQGQGLWVHAMGPDSLFSVRGQLQFADRPLPAVEQVSLGGIDTVRGYRTGALSSDNTALLSTEAYVPFLRIPAWKSVVQVVPFLDIAKGWNRDEDQPNPNFLMSTGLGLQWKIGDSFRARLDWGLPLVNSRASNKESLREGLFFTVQLSN